jgi:hypothetical protein
MLGLEGTKQPTQSLMDYIARKGAATPHSEPHTAPDASYSTALASLPAVARSGVR